MTEHQLVGSGTVTGPQFEGSIDLKEIECGGQYFTVEFGANYCPECGEEL